jgi:hypothetical protein
MEAVSTMGSYKKLRMSSLQTGSPVGVWGKRNPHQARLWHVQTAGNQRHWLGSA